MDNTLKGLLKQVIEDKDLTCIYVLIEYLKDIQDHRHSNILDIINQQAQDALAFTDKSEAAKIRYAYYIVTRVRNLFWLDLQDNRHQVLKQLTELARNLVDRDDEPSPNVELAVPADQALRVEMIRALTQDRTYYQMLLVNIENRLTQLQNYNENTNITTGPD